MNEAKARPSRESKKLRTLDAENGDENKKKLRADSRKIKS